MGRLLGRNVDRHCVAVLMASDISAGCVARARPPHACASPCSTRPPDISENGTQRALSSRGVCVCGGGATAAGHERRPAKLQRGSRAYSQKLAHQDTGGKPGGSQEEEKAARRLWVPAGCGAVWFDSTGPRAPSFRLARPGASRHVCATAEASTLPVCLGVSLALCAASGSSPTVVVDE